MKKILSTAVVVVILSSLATSALAGGHGGHRGHGGHSRHGGSGDFWTAFGIITGVAALSTVVNATTQRVVYVQPAYEEAAYVEQPRYFSRPVQVRPAYIQRPAYIVRQPVYTQDPCYGHSDAYCQGYMHARQQRLERSSCGLARQQLERYEREEGYRDGGGY